jgi:hypothetical protein
MSDVAQTPHETALQTLFEVLQPLHFSPLLNYKGAAPQRRWRRCQSQPPPPTMTSSWSTPIPTPGALSCLL